MTKKEVFPSVKTPSISEIAKKHNVTVAYLSKQLVKGIKVENEHTKNTKAASEIARDHLNERPDYYERLEKVEGKKKLNEISKDKADYHAYNSDADAGYAAGRMAKYPKGSKIYNSELRIFIKRAKGSMLARKKLYGKARVNATDE